MASMGPHMRRVRPQATSHPFEITYGTGAVAGTVAFETLTLGSGSNTLVVPHQGFGMVYDSSIDFLTASCDGLFVRTLCPSSAAWRCSSLHTA